jgi:predicted transcriptional regulator of viral defense system
LAALGVPRSYLSRLCSQGVLERVERGLYVHVDAPATENRTLVEVARKVPRATACLLTALQLHDLTTELPTAVWLLIDRHARAPKLRSTRVEVIRASGLARTHGIETRTLEGVDVRVTSPAKTVADCFRYRRHVGLEVALSALRAFLGARDKRRGAGWSIDDLVTAAKADRIYGVLRPYLEALA